mgnify:CR=1 FL=1
MLKPLFSYLISIVIMVIAIKINGGEKVLLDFYSLGSLVIILAGFTISLVNFKVSEILNAFKDAMFNSTKMELTERHELDKAIFSTMGNYIIFASILCTLSNILFMLMNLEDTFKASHQFAVSCLPILYAVILKFLFFAPLITSIEKKTLQSNQNNLEENRKIAV